MKFSAQSSCINLEKLVDYLRVKDEGAARQPIASHLATGCRTCTDNQQWLAEVLGLTATDQSFDFPEAPLQRTLAIFNPRRQKSTPKLREIVAQLVFDSFWQPQPVQMRVGAPAFAHSRQLLFRAEGYDIDIRFELAETGQTDELMGQVLPTRTVPHALASLPVQLWQTDILQAEAQTNARGIFKFKQVNQGRYTLKLTAPEGVICLDPLETTQHLV
jgi:hypothetical protein